MGDFGLSPASMSDATYLRLRNVELEIELRSVKDKLGEAHNNTQFLVSCLASAHASRPIVSANSIGSPLPRMQKENEYSTRQLGIPLDSSNETHLGNGLGDPQTRLHGFQHSLSHHASDIDPKKQSLVQPAHTQDLITFEGDEVPPITTNPVPVEYARAAKSSNKDAIGLGISKAEAPRGRLCNSTRGIDEEQEYIHGHGMYRRKKSNYHARPPSETYDKDASAPTGTWSSIDAAPPPEPEFVFDRPFLDAEHNRLLNAACFIEDMTKEEKRKHWIKMGREKGRHSAREWRLYYEKVIRPAFTAKSQRVGDTPKPALTRAPTGARALTDQDIDVGKLAEGHGDLDSHKAGATETVVEVPAVYDAADKTVPQRPQNLEQSASAPSTPIQAALEVVSTHPLANDFTKLYQGEPLVSYDDQNYDSSPGQQPRNVPTPSKLDISDCEAMASPSPLPDLKTTLQTPKTDDSPAINTPPTDSQDSSHLRSRPRFSALPSETSQSFYGSGSKNPSAFRTMLIYNIDARVTLARVVSAIRGGPIVKATFLETKGMKTIPPMTTNAAMIEFRDASAASAALDHWTENHFALQGCQSGVQPLTASILRTPTRQLPIKLERDMHTRGLTRVFYIVDEKLKRTPQKVMQLIMCCDSRQRRPLVLGRRENDVLFFEFANVRQATMAWDVVHRDQGTLRRLKKGFLPDPCSELGSEEEESAESEDESEVDSKEKEGEDVWEVENESDGASTCMNTPAASFEVYAADD